MTHWSQRKTWNVVYTQWNTSITRLMTVCFFIISAVARFMFKDLTCKREAIFLSSQHKNKETLTECQLVINVTAGLIKTTQVPPEGLQNLHNTCKCLFSTASVSMVCLTWAQHEIRLRLNTSAPTKRFWASDVSACSVTMITSKNRNRWDETLLNSGHSPNLCGDTMYLSQGIRFALHTRCKKDKRTNRHRCNKIIKTLKAKGNRTTKWIIKLGGQNFKSTVMWKNKC